METSSIKRVQEGEHSKLPIELIIDILSRLPVKSLKRFECVSKEWLGIIQTDQLFSLIHLRQSSHYPMLLIAPILVICEEGKHELSVIMRANNRYMLDSLPVHFMQDPFFIMNSCRGMLCIVNSDVWDTISIWNPVRREYATLPDDEAPVPVKEIYMIGIAALGYDAEVEKYKVIRLYEARNKYIGAKILTVGTNTWRFLDKIHDTYMYNESFPEPAVTMRNSMYWLMTRGKYRKLCLLSFNITSEEIRVTSVPPFFEHYDVVRIGNFSGRLAVYSSFRGDFIVTVMSNKRNMWIKSFIIPFFANAFKTRGLQASHSRLGICPEIGNPEEPSVIGRRVYATDRKGVYILDLNNQYVVYDSTNMKFDFISSTYGNWLLLPHVDSLISPISLL